MKFIFLLFLLFSNNVFSSNQDFMIYEEIEENNYLSIYPEKRQNKTCVKQPYPDPSGDIVTVNVSTVTSGLAWKFEFWRVTCSESDSNLLVKVSPLKNGVQFCSGISATVIQNGVQYDSFRLANGASSFCDEVYIPTTLLILGSVSY